MIPFQLSYIENKHVHENVVFFLFLGLLPALLETNAADPNNHKSNLQLLLSPTIGEKVIDL